MAGYIGSHVVRQLGAGGEDVITLDNLSTGFSDAVTAGELVVGDTGDFALLDQVFSEHDIDTVMHFAAHTIVPESVFLTRSSTTATTRRRAARCSKLRTSTASGTSCFHQQQLFYGIPDGGKSLREITDRSNQSLRHVEADDRVDVA